MRNFFLVLLFFSFSCLNNKKKTDEHIVLPLDIPLLNRGTDVEPLIEKTDSVQVLFYDDPDGDPKRYSRYFKYTATSDTAIIQSLKNNLRQNFHALDNVKNCRSEGKVYLFQKGEILKTVFFSTRCDTCCYLYFIKDGRFFYMPLTNTFKDDLKILKRKSVVPVAPDAME